MRKPPAVRKWAGVLAALAGAGMLLAACAPPPAASSGPAWTENGARLFAALDQTSPFIKEQAARWQKAQAEIAAHAPGQAPAAEAARAAVLGDLLRHFHEMVKSYQTGWYTALPEWNADTHREADDAVKNTFTEQGVTATVPHAPEGGLDWSWRGPNDDPEFAWFLNRLHQLPALLVAWRETHDKRYLDALNAQLRDWIAHNPRPHYYSLSSAWRALEAARRMDDSWLPMLFSPQALDLAPDVQLGLLADIQDHAECLRDTHAPYGNHLISEMGGLATIALAFPAFKDAASWLDYAMAKTHAEMNKQIYPDGTHTELAGLYQRVVLQSLQDLADVLKAAHRGKEFAGLKRELENGWNYYAYVMTPRGEGPLNNDSDLDFNRFWLRDVVTRYERKDWQFLATAGREGTEPANPPSRYFPWAGQAVMRGGWGTRDQWAYFDAGPYGTDHQHEDRLHLSISGESRNFLTDNGRFTYVPGPWRDYFAGPTGHNIILLDGHGTSHAPNRASREADVRHEITPALDFFAATAPYAGDWLAGQGPSYHTRAILYIRADYWIVADRVLTAGGPRRVDALWHFHPDCDVKSDGNLVFTTNAREGNLGLLAVEAKGAPWTREMIKGREGDAPQGWYSAQLNERLAATCADFSTIISSPHTFAWVIWMEPAGRPVPALQPHVEVLEDSPARLRLRLRWPGGKTDEATIPFTAEGAVAWKTS